MAMSLLADRFSLSHEAGALFAGLGESLPYRSAEAPFAADTIDWSLLDEHNLGFIDDNSDEGGDGREKSLFPTFFFATFLFDFFGMMVAEGRSGGL